MLNKPITCKGCSLGEEKTGGFSRPEGTCRNGVLFIGESLGQNEKYEGLPFRPFAEAGAALQTAISRMGMNRSDFGFWNLIACQPPFNILNGAVYEETAISHCRVHFDAVLKKLKPKVIMALGDLPLKHLSPEIYERKKIAKELKNKELIKKLSNTSLRGYQFDSIFGIPLVVGLHPSYVRRTNMVYLHVLMQDIYFALQVAKKNVPVFESFYNLNPTTEDGLKYYEFLRQNPSIPVSYDIETPYTTIETDESEVEYKNQSVREILSIQFSSQERAGLFFDWTPEFRELSREILALPNPKIGWNNFEFDTHIIEYHLGKGAVKGPIYDIMWFWKHFNSDFGTSKNAPIGRGLQFATSFQAPGFPAWKHLSEEDPRTYGCMDVDATIRVYNGLSKGVATRKLNKDSKTLLEGYMDDVVKLHPILQDISKRGFPIDLVERDKFKKILKKEIRQTLFELQKLFPFHLRKTDPDLGYKRVPKEIFEIREKYNTDIEDEDLDFHFIDNKKEVLPMIVERETRTKIGMSGLVLREFRTIDGIFNRYCRIEEFKPTSPKQVISYMKWKKHKVPVKRDKIRGEVDTTEKDQVYLLWEETGDELYRLSSYVRELRKMLSTYVGTGKKGWQIGDDERVHTTFTFIPATGQLSSRNPNIQNAPARGTRFSSKGYKELANQFRRTVAAKGNKVLLSADWSSFHALILGFLSEDPTYMRLVRHDIHSYVAAYILKDELPPRLIELKKISRQPDFERISKYEEALVRLANLDKWIELPDKQLKENLTWIKKNFKQTRDAQAKPAILGIGFGMGVKKFFKLNRYSFKNISQPTKIHQILKQKFPRIFKWHEVITDLADRQMYLISQYGYMRRFHDVYDYRLLKDKRPPKPGETFFTDAQGRVWSKNRGQQFNEAVAYLPANGAFGKKKESMRDLWAYESDGIIRNIVQEFGLVNEIHDELIFEVEEKKLEEAAGILKSVMERPARFLVNSVAPEGLVTRVELKSGPNWGSMTSLEI